MRTGLVFIGIVFATANISQAGSQLLDFTQSGTLYYQGAEGKLTGTTGGEAVFRIPTMTQAVGTGVIDSFLRLQANPASGTASPEMAFNTDARDVVFKNGTVTDAKTDPNFTRSITLGEIPVVNIGGTDYREFALDINEPSADTKSTLSLNELQFFVDTTASADSKNYANNYHLSSPDNRTLETQNGTILNPVFDLGTMGTGSANTVLLDYNLIGGGSGQMFDLLVYIPDADFDGFSNNDHVILYNILGASNGNKADPYDAQGGFEEWAVFQSSSEGPTPGPSVDSRTVFDITFASRVSALCSRSVSENGRLPPERVDSLGPCDRSPRTTSGNENRVPEVVDLFWTLGFPCLKDCSITQSSQLGDPRKIGKCLGGIRKWLNPAGRLGIISIC